MVRLRRCTSKFTYESHVTFPRVYTISIRTVRYSLSLSTLASKYTTNLKYHIKNKHPKEYSTILAIESTLKKAKEEAKAKRAISHKASVTATKQLTLTESLSATKQYRKESEKYQSITLKLAIFVGSNNVANSIVESAEFKELVHTLDSRYKVPGRKALNREMEKVLIEIKAKASTFIQEAAKVSICADI